MRAYWPLAGLRLTTARLVLRLPSPDVLGELGELAAQGVPDLHVQPFAVPWSAAPPSQRVRRPSGPPSQRSAVPAVRRPSGPPSQRSAVRYGWAAL